MADAIDHITNIRAVIDGDAKIDTDLETLVRSQDIENGRNVSTCYADGIAWRTDEVKEDIAGMTQPWDIFWESQAYKGKVALLSENRETIGMALLRKGITDINTEDPALVNPEDSPTLTLGHTRAGTVLIKDINPDWDYGYSADDRWPVSSFMAGMTNVNGTLFFSADDGKHGWELWKSDGTAAGTMMVTDINPGGGGCSPQSLVNVNGELYFSANDGTHGYELWITDGTAAGTTLVKNINPGSASAVIQDLTKVADSTHARSPRISCQGEPGE